MNSVLLPHKSVDSSPILSYAIIAVPSLYPANRIYAGGKETIPKH